MSYFSEKLKDLRKLNGMTQDQFAKKLGISQSSVGMYESAAREPDFQMLERIASALNVHPGTFLSESDSELFETYQSLSDSNKTKVRELIVKLAN